MSPFEAGPPMMPRDRIKANDEARANTTASSGSAAGARSASEARDWVIRERAAGRLGPMHPNMAAELDALAGSAPVADESEALAVAVCNRCSNHSGGVGNHNATEYGPCSDHAEAAYVVAEVLGYVSPTTFERRLAQAVSDALNAAADERAAAWDEGHGVGWMDCVRSKEATQRGQREPDETPNPHAAAVIARGQTEDGA